MIEITLKKGKEQSIFRRHPWIYSGAIKTIHGEPKEGDLVAVLDYEGKFLAKGHYQPVSIAVQIVTFVDEVVDEGFWNQRIQSAFNLRQTLQLTNNEQTSIFRLVHGEGDNLPGLIIDMYRGIAVVQFYSVGMYLEKKNIVHALKTVLGNLLKGIYNKSESTLPYKAEVKAKNDWLWKTDELVENIGDGNENTLGFHVDFLQGQKTGFFVDQRENRKLLSHYCKGKDVLNMFCYTGGFSVYALKGGANKVVSVDSSIPAIALTDQNVEMNFGANAPHESFALDAFDFLNTIDQQYDVIVLDPPAFAKHNSALKNALQAYKRINQKAIKKIRPGGILFTFSCSQVVSKENFRKSVFAAAANTKRRVSILHQLTQPADHPINIYHPEGEYLKGLVVYVE